MQQTTADISALHQPMQQHPRSEIWRSETVVQIFIDMWLNNDQINNVDASFNLQTKVISWNFRSLEVKLTILPAGW